MEVIGMDNHCLDHCSPFISHRCLGDGVRISDSKLICISVSCGAPEALEDAGINK